MTKTKNMIVIMKEYYIAPSNTDLPYGLTKYAGQGSLKACKDLLSKPVFKNSGYKIFIKTTQIEQIES